VGFTSILDRDAIDWINFRPEGMPDMSNGRSGWFRGIPNMARSVFGDSGYTAAPSTTANLKGVPLLIATVGSTKDGRGVLSKAGPNDLPERARTVLAALREPRPVGHTRAIGSSLAVAVVLALRSMKAFGNLQV
jgi:hypothetical protein